MFGFIVFLLDYSAVAAGIYTLSEFNSSLKKYTSVYLCQGQCLVFGMGCRKCIVLPVSDSNWFFPDDGDTDRSGDAGWYTDSDGGKRVWNVCPDAVTILFHRNSDCDTHSNADCSGCLDCVGRV